MDGAEHTEITMALNTPHARRHIARLLRRGFTTYATGTGSGPGLGLSKTDADGSTRDYVGTPAQAIALAAGRRAATGGGWNGVSGAESQRLTYWVGGSMYGRRHARRHPAITAPQSEAIRYAGREAEE